MNTSDVYSYGVVSSSTLYSIKGAFPATQGYAEMDDVQFMTGGEATNSSIVLSRLGVSVKLDGNWLGADDAGKRTKALLDHYKIDSSRLPLKEGYEGVSEVVFAAGDTRTIFGTYGRLLEKAEWNMPHEDDIGHAKVVCLDPFFGEASIRAAELGHGAGIPVVTVDCPYDGPLAAFASAIVVAQSYIHENYPDASLEDLFRRYQSSCSGLVVFTFGSHDLWYAMPGEPVKTFQPFDVDVVDTTGGGDAFRAGIVYGYLRKWSPEKAVRFAAAVAGLVCTRFPGVLDAPTRDEVVRFMDGTGISG